MSGIGQSGHCSYLGNSFWFI